MGVNFVSVLNLSNFKALNKYRRASELFINTVIAILEKDYFMVFSITEIIITRLKDFSPKGLIKFIISNAMYPFI